MYVTALSESQFTEALASGKMVIALFGARWCPHCQATKPIVRRYAAAHNDVIGIEVDCDQYVTLANRYHINSLPTVIIFIAGQKRGRGTGAIDQHTLNKLIAKAQGHE